MPHLRCRLRPHARRLPALAFTLAASLTAAAISPLACAQDSGGLLHLDRFGEKRDTGLLSRSNQKRLDALVISGVLGTALWEGTETPLGRVTWQSLDAMLTTAATTEVMKNVFTRPRPAQNPDPNVWFAGSGHKSFPSGETAMMAAFVTPWILELHEERPEVWGLVALPLYMGAARMASQAHWLTDVLVGAGVGAVMGVQAHQRTQPLVLAPTRGGAFVGWKTKF